MGRPLRTETAALLVLVLISCFCFSGLIFGWVPLVLWLKEEGQFTELCPIGQYNGTATANTTLDTGYKHGMGRHSGCVAQDNALNLIFTIGTFAMYFGVYFESLFLDYVGPTAGIFVAGVVEASGLYLLAVSDSVAFDAFIPAIVLLALGGQMTMLAAYMASFMIPSKQSSILAAINFLFDGSSIMFFLLYFLDIHQSFLSRKILLVALAVFAVVVYGSLTCLWRRNRVFFRLRAMETFSSAPGLRSPSGPTMTAMEKEARRGRQARPTSCGGGGMGSLVVGSGERRSLLDESGHKHAYSSGTLDERAHQLPRTSSWGPSSTSGDHQELLFTPKHSLRDQMFSKHFLFVVTFLALHLLRASVYIGTQNQLLNQYYDHKYHHFFTQLFAVALPLGFLFVGPVEKSLEMLGVRFSLHCTTLIGIMVTVFAMVPILPLQAFTFLMFTGFRTFLYACVSTFFVKTFAINQLGSLVGAGYTISSFVLLLQYPVVVYANVVQHGDLSCIHYASLASALLLLVVTEVYRRSFVRPQQEEESDRNTGDMIDGSRAPLTPDDVVESSAVMFVRAPSLHSPMARMGSFG